MLNRALTVAGLFILVPSVASAQLLPRWTRAPRACCLPGGYDYSVRSASAPVTAYTFSGTDFLRRYPSISGITTDATSVTARRFPLQTSALQHEHCRLRQVAVTFDSSGHWTLDCIAEQNPDLAGPQRSAAVSVYSQNRFAIRLRPLTDTPLQTDNTSETVAPASAGAITVDPFWLRRGETRRIFRSGTADPATTAAFEQIRFFAVDLTIE